MNTLKLKFSPIILFVALLFGQTTFASSTHDGEEKLIKVTETQNFAYNVYAFRNALKFKLAFQNASEEKIVIKILDQTGKLVHKEVLKNQENLNRNYDLSKVGAGIYKVEIEMGELKAENEIAVGLSDNQLDNTFQAYISPVIRQNTIRVFYKNGADVNISMRDAQGNIVYQDSTKDANMYAKKYDVSSLKKGTYVLSLTSGDKTIEKIYSI